MISESINTQRTLKWTLANRFDQNQEKSSESDQGLHYLLKIPGKWEWFY